MRILSKVLLLFFAQFNFVQEKKNRIQDIFFFYIEIYLSPYIYNVVLRMYLSLSGAHT